DGRTEFDGLRIHELRRAVDRIDYPDAGRPGYPTAIAGDAVLFGDDYAIGIEASDPLNDHALGGYIRLVHQWVVRFCRHGQRTAVTAKRPDKRDDLLGGVLPPAFREHTPNFQRELRRLSRSKLGQSRALTVHGTTLRCAKSLSRRQRSS